MGDEERLNGEELLESEKSLRDERFLNDEEILENEKLLKGQKLLKECIKYFKESKGFKSVFEGIRGKYRSLGYPGGTVIITNPTTLEREAISGLLKRDCYSNKTISVKVEIMIKAIEGTKFQGVDFEEVLMGYWSGSLISKRDEKDIYELKKNKYFTEILTVFDGTRGGKWLQDIIESHENAYKIISLRYDRDEEKLKGDLIYTLMGLNRLSFNQKDTTRHALFSSSISKNPHYFDMDKDCGKMLIQGITHILNLQVPQNAEDRAETLYSAGIINDEISNYTMCSNLEAYIGGVLHRGWHGFFEKGEPLQVSLWNLAAVDKIGCPSRKVYVFENPTVFSEVLINTSHQRPSLICTYGQIKLASLVLLDKLVDNVDNIYYSGDIDPEGIMIADKLKQRYKEKLILWHYNVEDYNHIKSKEKLDVSRIKKLEKVKSPELVDIARVLMQEGCPGYQELLVDKYIEDIIK